MNNEAFYRMVSAVRGAALNEIEAVLSFELPAEQEHAEIQRIITECRSDVARRKFPRST